MSMIVCMLVLLNILLSFLLLLFSPCGPVLLPNLHCISCTYLPIIT